MPKVFVLDRDIDIFADRDEDGYVVVRGGKGSGHHGHAGRPGKVGGSLPAGAGDVGGGGVEKGDWRDKLEDVFLHATMSPEAIDFIEKYADELRGHEFETGIVISKEGDFIMAKEGARDKVSFTDEECERVFDKVVIHNHPSNGVLTLEDIHFMQVWGAHSIVAVTDWGLSVAFNYSPDVMSFSESQDNMYSLTRIRDEVKAPVDELYLSGEIDDAAAWSMANTLAWEKLDEENPGFDFFVIRRDE